MREFPKEKFIFIVVILALVWGLGGFAFIKSKSGLAAEVLGDTTPPDITGIDIDQLSATSVSITWNTNEAADTTVNYGLNKDYGVVRNPYLSPTSHQVVVTNLIPGTQYFYRVISLDSSNNQSISADYSFTTTGTAPTVLTASPTPTPPPRPQLPDNTGQQIPVNDDILKIIEAITDPELLAKIAEKIEEIADRIIAPPVIVGNPEVIVGIDYAQINWITDKASNSLVSFATTEEYNPVKENPYASQQGSFEEQVTEHKVRLVGLLPATIYHYQISSAPDLGPPGKTLDKTFTTKSVLPEIRSVTLKKVEEHSATLTWVSNVPTDAIISYTNLNTRETKTTGNPTYLTNHTLKLDNLEFKTPYIATIKAENEAGEETVSRPVSFTTIKDEFPPVITRVANESTLYPGSEAKVQTIINWESDEPSLCQFYYQEGIAPGAKAESLLPESNPVLKHVQVMTAFKPSTIYKFWVECLDIAENKARSDDFVLFTPEKEKSIIDVILENFEGTFGWVKNIGK